MLYLDQDVFFSEEKRGESSNRNHMAREGLGEYCGAGEYRE